MKKIVAILLTVCLTAGLLSACGNSGNDSNGSNDGGAVQGDGKWKMAMITDTGGLGDNGFNDMAWAGMEKARDELGFEIGLIESTEASQYAANIAAAADQGYNVILCVGYLLADALAEVAPQYPDVNFMIIDGSVEGDNVFSFVYSMEETSFLAGALAAYVLPDCDTFGTVGGMEIPDVIAWANGYQAGILAVKPDAKVLRSYVGSFADPGIAKELALAQFNQGAEVVMEISSGGAIGVIEAAKEAGKKFIATDKSKDDQAPGCELTAALAGRDMAVFNAAKQLVEGTAAPGVTHLTMKDGVFDVPDYVESLYGKDAVDFVEGLKQKILSGEIEVPRTNEEMDAYTPPTLS